MPIIGINGMGVLGRRLLRMIIENETDDLVTHDNIALVNDPYITPEQFKYLYNHDTVYGKPKTTISLIADKGNYYTITLSNGKGFDFYNVPYNGSKYWMNIPSDAYALETMIDCIGNYLTDEVQTSYLLGGAKNVITCFTSTIVGFTNNPTIVWGINSGAISQDDKLYGCPTADMIASSIMIKILKDTFTVDLALCEHMTSYTNLNNLQDSALSKTEQQIGRAGAWNIIPCKSNSAKAIGLVIPELNGKVLGVEHRCGTIAGSHTDVFANLGHEFDASTFADAVKVAGLGTIYEAYINELPCMEYSEDASIEVSSDTIGNPAVICNKNNYTDNNSTFVRTGVAYDAISVQAANAILIAIKLKRLTVN